MWIVAVAWIYVVVLMAATEPTVVHGFMTFIFYCALPLSIVLYLTGGKQRRARREARARSQAMAPAAAQVPPACIGAGSTGGADGGGCDGGAGCS